MPVGFDFFDLVEVFYLLLPSDYLLFRLSVLTLECGV